MYRIFYGARNSLVFTNSYILVEAALYMINLSDSESLENERHVHAKFRFPEFYKCRKIKLNMWKMI